MASTVTLVDTEPAYLYSPEATVNGNGPVYEYEISLDGAAGVQTVHTPEAGKRVWVVSVLEAETNPGNLILKSNPDTPSKTKTLELAANQAIYDKATQGYIFSTKAGEALGVDSSMAIGSLTIRLIESEKFFVR